MICVLLASIGDIPIDSFLEGGLFDIVRKFFDFIFAFVGNLVSALIQFYETIIEANRYVELLIEGAKTGTVEGLPLLQIIGAYRYLVTDPIFYFTYLLVLIGCLFTIYQLTLLLIASWHNFKESLNNNGSTTEGFLKGISKIFKS